MTIPPDAIKPVAEATRAVAETTGKALDVVSGVGKFLDRIVGNALAESGEALTDQVRFWRKMRLLELDKRFEAACAARNLSPETMKPLSLGKTVQVLEAASVEEEDEVQLLWAELLANAVDPACGVTVKKVYVTLLKDFSPADAVLLELLSKLRSYRRLSANRTEDIETTLRSAESRVAEYRQERWAKLSEADRAGAISNLRRLGCIVPNFARPPSVQRLLTKVRVEVGLRRNPELVQIDARELQSLIVWMASSLNTVGGGAGPNLPDSVEYHTEYGFRIGRINVPELNLELTPIGVDLVKACAPAAMAAQGDVAQQDERPLKPPE